MCLRERGRASRIDSGDTVDLRVKASQWWWDRWRKPAHAWVWVSDYQVHKRRPSYELGDLTQPARLSIIGFADARHVVKLMRGIECEASVPEMLMAAAQDQKGRLQADSRTGAMSSDASRDTPIGFIPDEGRVRVHAGDEVGRSTSEPSRRVI